MRGIYVKKKPFIVGLLLFSIIEILIGGADSIGFAAMRLIVCFLFVYCVYHGLNEEFISNPYLVFSITPLSLLMYSEKISPYYLEKLEYTTWILAIVNILAFVMSLNYGINKYRNRTERNEETIKVNCKSTNITLHIILITIISKIPFVANALGIAFPLKSVLGFFSFIGIALAFRTKKKWLIAFTIIMNMVGWLQDFNKTRLMYLVMTVLVSLEAYYIKTKKDRLRLIAGFGIVAFFILVVSFPLKSFTRAGGSFADFFGNITEISANAFTKYDARISFSGPRVLQMPYMYLVSAWNNVQYVMQTQPECTYGLWTLKPILGYLQLDGIFADYYQLIPSSSFNTFTYITVLFKDFGYYGSIFGSVVLGLYVSSRYCKMKIQASGFAIATYGLVAMATLEMFFSNHFFGLSYPFTILIIGYIYKKIFKLEGY